MSEMTSTNDVDDELIRWARIEGKKDGKYFPICFRMEFLRFLFISDDLSR